MIMPKEMLMEQNAKSVPSCTVCGRPSKDVLNRGLLPRLKGSRMRVVQDICKQCCDLPRSQKHQQLHRSPIAKIE